MSYAGSVGARTRSEAETRAGEMKQELIDMGLYEDGMSTSEMDHMFRAYRASLNNTEDMNHENSLSTVNIPEDSEEASGPIPPKRFNSQKKKSLQMNPKILRHPKSVPSTPPDLTNHKITMSRSSRDSTSPELSSVSYSNRQKLQSKKSPDSSPSDSPETPPETGATIGTHLVLSPSPPRYGAPSTEAPQPHQSITSIPKKPQSAPPKMQCLPQGPRIELWKIDPWDPKQENDVPLRSLQRFQGSRAPVKYKIVDGVPELPEELKKMMDLSLQECHRCHFENHKDEFDNEVEWGSPIKVALGPWHGSLDKHYRPERELPEPRLGLRMPEKPPRKLSSETFSFPNSDEDEEFEETRKRPKPTSSRHLGPLLSQPGRRTRLGPRSTAQIVSPVAEEEPKSGERESTWEERPKSLPSRKRPMKTRESTLPEVPRSTREASPEYEPQEIPQELRGGPSNAPPTSPEVVDVSGEYPRRIIPPNPSRPRGPRGRQATSVSKLSGNRPQLAVARIPKKSQEESKGLTPDQIEAMITDDEDDSPIILPQKTSKRSQTAMAFLARAKEDEANEERKKMELERSRQDQEDRVKRERVREKIRAEQLMAKSKETCATLERERREKYKIGLPVRVGRRTELEGETARKTVRSSLLNWDANNRPTSSADEAERMFSDSSEEKKAQCPLCSEYFPQGEIATHADTCADSAQEGEFVDLEVDRRKTSSGRVSADLFECLKCRRFRTKDGHEFEEHTVACVHGRGSAGGSQSTPIDIPDSPIRSFKPLSKMENSEIDYNAQMRTRKASPRGGTRKRRKQH